MRRIALIIKEWYVVPGGMVVSIPFLLAIVLLCVGAVGQATLKLIF
ncbi:hypothetical protein LCGC14_0499020 [marine sediment metagenome]|uniref:Uncharacterized protein n=1 Tax=marine sediment metagenome TaxID=412755 RepID=A0A0F9S495_9ZZZZ